MTQEQKRLLDEPYAELLARAYERIENLSGDALAALLDAANSATQTNCWWATFHAAQFIKPVAASEIARRAARANQAIADARKEMTGR